MTHGKDGLITDLEISAVGMEWSGLKTSSWNDCHPDYALLESWINEDLFKEKG